MSEHFVRKGAHFGEYAVLSLLVCADVLSISELFEKMKGKWILLSMLLAIPVSAAVALFDEFGVQMVTEGRGPSLRDVLIDTSGAVFGVLAVIFILWICRAVRKR